MKNYSAKAKICAKSSIVALVLSSVGFTAPAFAVDDSAIILNDSICQLAGAGTATDPYQVATAKQLAEITGVFVSAPGSEITFVTDSHHNLQIGDIISVVRFNVQVNGVYIVNSIEKRNITIII